MTRRSRDKQRGTSVENASGMQGTTKQQAAIAAIALPVLVARLGGEATITRAEFEALHERFGSGKLIVEAQWREEDQTLHLKVARHLASPPMTN